MLHISYDYLFIFPQNLKITYVQYVHSKHFQECWGECKHNGRFANPNVNRSPKSKL